MSDVIFDGTVEWVSTDSLKPHPRNPRMGDVGAVFESVAVNGLYRPIYVQRSTRTIVAGHHLWRALADRDTVPVIWLDVDDDQAVRILIADNRASALGSFDDQALADLLTELAKGEGGLAGTLYDGDDLDGLLYDLALAAGGHSETPDSPPAAGPKVVTCPECGHAWERES